VTFLRSRRGVALLAVLLVILFLFRPGVFQLRNRISSSIGNALGRRVTIDNVRLHALPRPGFDLEGFVIYDDPAFSAEPMIRAQDVFAAIRLRSLLRGRLEIATLSATEPSINIVRANDGRWNLASLIERNAQIPAAPTQKAPSERRPAFPYLEATGARINFKFGAEKKSYALVDANVALWQDSENSWGARMRAQPVRTDFNLTDTGQLQINAAWQRAASLRQTPLRVTMAWQRGQLGQVTTLLTGKDRGWRGGMDFAASMEGTPEALTIESQAAIQSFRRYDILDNRNIRLATRCAGRYNATDGSVTGLLCESPAGGGTIRLSGNFGPRSAAPSYDLTLEARKIPVASLVELAHEAKQQLPRDLSAEGSLDAEFHAVRNGGTPAQFNGSGEAREVRLTSNGDNNSISLGNVPLTLVAEAKAERAGAPAHTKVPAIETNPEPAEPHLRIGPASLALNASPPLSSGGWISRNGYNFFLRGDLTLRNLFQLEDAFGVPALQPAAEGSARLDVSISGPWQGLAAPNALGTAQLKNVRAETRGLNTPIEIATATVTLGPEVTAVEKLAARTGETHWTGSVRAPRHCAPDCLYQFDLTADRLVAADLAEWFTAHPVQRPWYHILSAGQPGGHSPLAALQAHGSLHVAQFEMKEALAGQVTTELTADRGKIKLSHLRGQFLQGTHQGDWTIDATSQPREIHGTGTLQNISLERLGTLMNDAWITGNAEGSFEVKTTGASFREMLTNADGKLQFIMRNGSFAHVGSPDAPAPLPVYRFSGNLRAKEGKWQLSAGRLESRDGLYQVSGTSSGNALDFTLQRGDDLSWKVTGTISKPHAAPANEEISRTETKPGAGVKP
jgi:AsmA family